MTDRRASWWLRLWPVILAIMFCMMALVSAPKSVQAASWNQAAYNSALVKGTWKSTVNGGVGGPEYYLDSAGTLHIGPSTSPMSNTGWTSVGTTTLDSKKSSVKAISFDGPTIFVDQTNGINGTTGLFQQFLNLERITGLENVDVSRMTTMQSLFADSSAAGVPDSMQKLTTISGLSNWDVSHVTTMAYMFQKDPLLTHVDGIENWQTNSVTDINHLFFSDSSLATLPDLSKWDISKVENFEYAFSGMTSLTTLTGLDHWDVSSGTNFQFMFSDDSALSALNIQPWQPKHADRLNNMFQNDTSLTSLDLHDWNVAKATRFDEMFHGDKQLSTLNLSGWQPTAGEQFGYMFADDAKLTSLDVAGWTMANAQNMTSMFQNMTTVKALDVSAWAIPARANVTTLFDGDYALTSLNLANWRLGSTWGPGEQVFPSYDYADPTKQSQLKSITFGPNMTAKIAFPSFTLPQGTYGVWRGVKTDKALVKNAGAANETYTPTTTAAQNGDTYRFAWDIQAKLVNSAGAAVALAGVVLKVTNADGDVVATGTTGADGTVTIPMNAVSGDYTVTITDGVKAGYEITKGTATTTINNADGKVQLVVDEVHDEDIIKQFPAAGGNGPWLLIAATGFLLVGGYGVWRQRKYLK